MLFGGGQSSFVPVERRWDTPLFLFPGWRDRRFADLQSVFLADGFSTKETQGIAFVDHDSVSYAYADRLRTQNPEKWKEAWQGSPASQATARQIQDALGRYFGSPVALLHVMVALNASSGYPVHYYEWLKKEQTA